MHVNRNVHFMMTNVHIYSILAEVDVHTICEISDKIHEKYVYKSVGE